MIKQLVICIVSLTFLDSCIAQILPQTKVVELHSVIGNWLSEIQLPMEKYANKPSELFILSIRVDSNGYADNIVVYSDNNSKDSAMSLLKRFEVKDLYSWHCIDCKNKSMILPILLEGSKPDTGLLHFQNSNNSRRAKVIGVYGNLVYLSVFYFQKPVTEEKK